MLADISSRRSSIQSMQGLVLLIFIVSIFDTIVRLSALHFYSCLFPCKTAREYFLAVLFLFEIS